MQWADHTLRSNIRLIFPPLWVPMCWQMKKDALLRGFLDVMVGLWQGEELG